MAEDTKDKKHNRYSKIIIAIFVISLLIRLAGVNDMMYNDEGSRAITVRDSSFMENLVGKGTAQPPMYSWIVMSVTSLFGTSNIAFRITHIIFGMLSIYLIFLFSKRYFGEKAALWATAIAGFSYYHIVASIQITLDGSILAFFSLLTLYCFMRYFESDKKDVKSFDDFKSLIKNKWLLLTGVGFGLALLTKISAILLIPAIIIYSLYKTRNIKRAFFDTAISGLIGVLFLSVYFFLSIFERSGVDFLLTRAGDVVAYPATNLVLLAIQFLQAGIWIGPFLLGMLVLCYLSLLKKEERDENSYLLLIFISVVLIFYVFIIKDNFRPVERYLMAITGPLCILSGAYLSRIKFRKEHLYLFLAVFLLFSGLLAGLSMKQNEYLSFYPKEEFISKAMSFDWAIQVPLLGNEGPIGFYLPLDSIIYSFMLAFAALLIYLALKYLVKNRYLAKKKYLVSILIVFIAISASFNILITEEYLFAKTSPDIEKISEDIIDFANSHELKTPLFFFRNFALEFYTTEKYGPCPYPLEFWGECSLDFAHENNEKKIELIEKGGTVLVIDFPKMNRNSLLWKKFNECKKIKSFYDKEQEIGFVIEC